jgi:hypothetical protein
VLGLQCIGAPHPPTCTSPGAAAVAATAAAAVQPETVTGTVTVLVPVIHDTGVAVLRWFTVILSGFNVSRYAQIVLGPVNFRYRAFSGSHCSCTEYTEAAVHAVYVYSLPHGHLT